MGAPWIVDDGWWELIESLLPSWPIRAPGPRPVDDRRCLQPILFVLPIGIGWQDLPQELGFGSGMTCWRRLTMEESPVDQEVPEAFRSDRGLCCSPTLAPLRCPNAPWVSWRKCCRRTGNGWAPGASCPPRSRLCWCWRICPGGDTYQRLATGFGVGLATAHRYVREAVALLAGLGRSLTAALWVLACTHSNVALLDGTLVRTNRIRAHNWRYYAGRHRHHGVNLQGLTDPQGRLIWISDGLPGSTHDLSAVRTHGVFAVATAHSSTCTPPRATSVVTGSPCSPPIRGATWRTSTGTLTAVTPRSAPTANAASPS